MWEMDEPTRDKPALSVVIASYNAEQTIQGCLSSLRSQQTDERFEVIVVDSSADSTGDLVEAEYPEAKLRRFPSRKFCGDARNVGIAVARGDIIALTDADCVATKTWVGDILKAHRASNLAIGGAVANAEPSGLVGWAAYFCEFSRWMPGTKAQWLDDIAGANMSYKKKAFDAYGSFIEGTYCSDSEFHWRLGRNGQRLWFVPEIVVSHRSIDGLRQFLRHEFEHGGCFARVRMEAERFSNSRRLIYVLLSPLIPSWILAKLAWHNVRNRIYLGHFLRALPLVTVGVAAWSAGELVSYARGWQHWSALRRMGMTSKGSAP
jgi:glycosyltransferase involved in cell wall biosynthesis